MKYAFCIILFLTVRASAGTGYTVTIKDEVPFHQFLQLYDTPEAYTGSGGKAVIVNAGATALEFGDVPSHVHDGATLELDAVDSDGGAFAFDTTGDVTFSESITADGYSIAATGGGILQLETTTDNLELELTADNLEFETAAATNQIIYLNAGGDLSYESGFEYDPATDILTVATLTLSTELNATDMVDVEDMKHEDHGEVTYASGSAVVEDSLTVASWTLNTSTIAGLSLNIVAKTAAYTATASDDIITCGAGNETFTIDLPTPASGKIYFIKNVGTGVITVDADTTGSTTIDGETTQTIDEYESLAIASDASVYWII